MDHAPFERVLQSLGHVESVFAGPCDRQRSLLGNVCQVPARDEIHYEEMRLPRMSCIERADNVWMIELGGRLHLAPEPQDCLWVGRHTAADHF